jgi:hypothetical protein|tara:strand:+ start:969 stop:1214 length:246 start_codon:yes stop_codon:yes gene_type:complete
MADASFLYIAFFLTVGSFLLGSIVVWNVKDVYDEWRERADYARIVMHPEMYDEDGELITDDSMIYLRYQQPYDMLDDEDEE